jgi:hypothetical protein
MNRTTHRPGKEAAKRPSTPLEKLSQAILSSRPAAFARALGEIHLKKPDGNWGHRALGIALTDGAREHKLAFVEALLASKNAPKPTENSDFIRLAIEHDADDCLGALLDGGFKPMVGKKTINILTGALQRGRWPEPERVCPELSVRYPGKLADVCVMYFCWHMTEPSYEARLKRLDTLWNGATAVDLLAQRLLGSNYMENAISVDHFIRGIGQMASMGWVTSAAIAEQNSKYKGSVIPNYMNTMVALVQQWEIEQATPATAVGKRGMRL